MSNFWFNVRDYGAVGDGTTDDRGAIQTAVNAAIASTGGGGTVYFPRGTYALAKNGAAIPLIELANAQNIHFVGDGVGRSILQRKAGTYSNDTHIIQITYGSNLSFKALTLDGNRADCLDSDEQRHGLYISGLKGSVSNVWVTQCEFKNLRGDGIFILGDVQENPAYTVRQVWVTQCKFYNNERSGIACQRGLAWFWFLENDFEQITGQSIDTESSLKPEATDRTGALTDGWIVGNKIFHDNYTVNNALAVSGMATPDYIPARRIVVANNLVRGGAVKVAKVDQIDMIDNVIIGDTSNRVLDISDVLNMRIRGGYIEGNCDRIGTESAVQIQGVNFTMSNVTVQGVTIKQAATTTALDVLRVHNFRQGASVIGCTLIGNGTTNSTGLRFDGAAKDGVTRYGITASGNIIQNNHYGIILRSANSSTLLDSVNLSGNTFFDDQATPSQTRGILFASGNNADFIQNGTLTVSGNTFGRGITTTIQNDANVNRYATSGQGANNNAGVGGTMWWVRTGAPTFSAPNGDIAIRADGGAGSTFYVREGGSWVAK